MELNADFSQRVAVHSATQPWKPSPMPGVDRRMLDRIGGEVARATTIVRYAPGSAFAPHVHTGGEEFLVLDGVFQDEHGDFPIGTYVRNPPESRHTPGSAEGCTIFVKLWQFDLEDRTQVRIETANADFTPDLDRPGVSTLPLFTDAREDVRMETWAASAMVPITALDGIEILVVDGSFSEAGETFEPGSWLRLPKDSKSLAHVGSNGARVWVKSGHLSVAPTAP